jgi:AraC-like DNA-binding protein
MKPELEFVKHSELSSVKIFIAEVYERTFHMHTDYEIGFLMDGSLDMIINGEIYHLKAGDVYFLNTNQVHAFKSLSAYNHALVIQISPKYVKNIIPDIGMVYMEQPLVAKSVDPKAYDEIVYNIVLLTRIYFNGEKYFEFNVLSKLNHMIYTLLKNMPHKVISQHHMMNKLEKSRRMNRILGECQSHYQSIISLSDLAEKEGVTTTYLSHFIKDYLGIGFQEYLNHLRLEHAEYLVRNTTLPLIDICMDSGFSSHKYLKKAFLQTYQCKPAEYRKNHGVGKASPQLKSYDNKERILSEQDALAVISKYMEHHFK